MPDENAFELLPRIKKLRPDLPIIVMSAQNTFMTAIKASERGAYDYLPKPFDLKELVAIVGRAHDRAADARRGARRAEDLENMPLVGRSPAMQEIYRSLARLMQTDLTVMITGESGTGKELVARALHDYGKRKNGPFVAINMAAIPRDLIESELFGHEKGAFTGANARSAGRFEQAEGGTLFLDEIGDMPMEAQTRLLRVLQQGEYTTVGGRTPIKTNVRIVAATNKDLRISIAAGPVPRGPVLPAQRRAAAPAAAARARRGHPDLARHFFAARRRRRPAAEALEPAALDRLKRYRWPGNIRELENLMRRLAALYPQEVITEQLIEAELGLDRADRASLAGRARRRTPAPRLAVSHDRGAGDEQFADGASSATSPTSSSRSASNLPPPGLYHRVLRELEAPLISAALAATRGNQIKAAELLGLNRNTLRKKIRDLDLKPMRAPALMPACEASMHARGSSTSSAAAISRAARRLQSRGALRAAPPQ